MSKSKENFEFTTPLQVGQKETVTILVVGQYYPEQCSREGVSYDIEEVWGGYLGETGFVKDNDLTLFFRACEVYEGPVSDKIKEAATSHVEYLTGYKSKEMVLQDKADNQLPDVFQNIFNNIFPNPDTYSAHAAMLAKGGLS